MLSGIGPTEELKKHDIAVLKDLPGIGRGLKDHAAVFLTALMKPGFTSRMAFETDSNALKSATAQWELDATGRLSSESQSLVVMFNKIPDIYKSLEFSRLSKSQRDYIIRDTIPTYETTFGGPKFPPSVVIPAGMEYLGITVFGMNPQGEGSVTLSSLSSSKPDDAAVIDTRTLEHPFDRLVLIEGLIDTLKIFKETKQYQKGFVSWLSKSCLPIQFAYICSH